MVIRDLLIDDIYTPDDFLISNSYIAYFGKQKKDRDQSNIFYLKSLLNVM